MSNHLKSQLFLATALVGLSATAANAQVAFPTSELHGMGASSIQVILPREMNCLSGNNGYGKAADGSIVAVAEGVYAGSDTNLDCSTQSIQPAISGKYFSTGSGAGRTAWKNISVAPALSSSVKLPTSWAPWTTVQFAMSDAPLLQAELDTFNGKTAAAKAGKAIQFPLYVLPVAIAYNPNYGRIVSSSTDLFFNNVNPVNVYNTPSGGLRLNKAAYCGIFNGYITNWNDAALKALNTKTVAKVTTAYSLMDSHDTVTRWTADGVPIRLVGRLDKSGTTDLFTRHLAAVCDTALVAGQVNAYDQNAELLPFDKSITVGTSNYSTSSTATFAGTKNLISGATFAAGAISGTEATGLFTLANGSGDVAAAINLAPDVASASNPDVLLNGHIGYIGADNVAPTPGQTLFAAALAGLDAKGKAAWLLPTAANATTAFGKTVLPPQSTAAGKFAPATVTSGLRSNPIAWTDALYVAAADGTSLANPKLGYPITGTTQLLTATCFAKPADRNALVTFISWTTGLLAKDSAGGKNNANFLNGVANGKIGIKTKANIAVLPKSWTTAIKQTFLVRSKEKNTTGTLGDLNLYIQNDLPAKQTVADALGAGTLVTKVDTIKAGVVTKTVYNSAGPNPDCTAGSGL